MPGTGSGEDATKLFTGNTVQDASLRVIKGSFAGTECTLGAGTVVIGRSSECELSLKGAQGVSRRHCKVQYLSDRFVVIDLESRNGTIVNGQSVERKVLEPGDHIEVGDEHILFVVESLDSLRAAPLGDDSISDVETALVPQAQTLSGAQARGEHEATDARPSPPPPGTADDGDDDSDELQETLPPQAVVTDPYRQRRPSLPSGEPELSSPYQHQAPPPSKSKAPLIFGLLSVVIIALAVFLVRDIMSGDDASTVAAIVDAGAVEAAVADGGGDQADAGSAAVVDAVVDAGSDQADAGAVVVVNDAGSGGVVDAGSATIIDAVVDAVVDAGSAEGDVVVRASDGGRAQAIAVKVGDVVKVGDALVTVTLDNGNLQRKLQALQREEREFAEVAKKVPAAKADLDSVRAELRRAEARLKPKTLKSDHAGTVTEVLVEVGGVVRDGAPIVKLQK